MHPYSIKSLEYGPQVVRRLMKALPSELIHQPTHPGRFSPLEVVCHLAFWEPVIRGRMELALAQDGASVEDWDEEAHARDHRYSELDWLDQLNRWIQGRAETVAFAKSLTPEALRQSYTHPTYGKLTLDDALGLIVNHDMYHVAQLTEVLLGD